MGGSWCLKLVSNCSNRGEWREEEMMLKGLELLQNWRQTSNRARGTAYYRDTWSNSILVLVVVSLPNSTNTLPRMSLVWDIFALSQAWGVSC